MIHKLVLNHLHIINKFNAFLHFYKPLKNLIKKLILRHLS